MRKRALSIALISILMTITVVFVVPNVAVANSFFWQGTDVSDSGSQGLLDYDKQREVHDALLDALPVQLYPEGPYAKSGVGYLASLDGLPNPNGGIQNGLVRMPGGVLSGTRGVRIPCGPGECWEGYTFLNSRQEPVSGGNGPLVLIDMDGTIVNSFGGGGSFGGAGKMLKGGFVISSERGDLVQRDWCSNEVKRFEGLNNHHDHQREGSTDGYYYPGQDAFTDHGKTLSLGSVNVGPDASVRRVALEEDTTGIVNVKRFDPQRPHRPLNDDVIREITWDYDCQSALSSTCDDIIFEWHARDYFVPTATNLGFGLYEDEAAQYALDLGLNSGGGGNSWRNDPQRSSMEDWSHGNSVAWLGNNRWYTKDKDERFHPDNIIADFRSLNTTVIIARYDNPGKWNSGDIVWRLGPHYGTDGPDGKVGQIIGQHMAYMIPDTVPGGGNIMIFDNGGGAGYGALIEGLTDPDTGEKLGFWPNKFRNFSRVLEINPITRQIVWQYVQAKPTPTSGDMLGNNHLFYSSIMSGAQRLPNGNTLITEADSGRIFEVNMDRDVVWEYAPDFLSSDPGLFDGIYRAYRVPYSWIPKNALKDMDDNGVYDMCE